MTETKDEDAIVDAMSHAMCDADGVRWFDPIRSWRNWLPFGRVVAHEDVRRPAARRQYRAHLAMLQAMEKQGD